MLQRRFILLILLCIGIFSGGSLISLLNFYDPYNNKILAIILASTSFILFVTSLSTIIVYFFKKIYYRGEVNLFHIFSSMRQSFLFCLLAICAIILYIYQMPFAIIFLLLCVLIICVELFIQNL